MRKLSEMMETQLRKKQIRDDIHQIYNCLNEHDYELAMKYIEGISTVLGAIIRAEKIEAAR